MKSGNWMNHLEYDWESPIWRHVFRGLSRGIAHSLRPRSTGMSDWDVDTLSLDAWVTDLETVVDAVGVERFPLLGISEGGAVAVAYAVRMPELCRALSCMAVRTRRKEARSGGERNARSNGTLMRLGWEQIIQALANVHRALFEGERMSRRIFQRAATENDLSPSALLDISTSSTISMSGIFCPK